MNVCRIFIIVIFCFTTGCASAPIPVTRTPEEAVDALANQLMPVLQNLAKQLNPTIAIIPFGGPKGKPTTFGKKMAALLQSKLISKNWKLIEREQIDTTQCQIYYDTASIGCHTKGLSKMSFPYYFGIAH